MADTQQELFSFDETTQSFSYENQNNKIGLQQAFQSIPRSNLFIERCLSEGKPYLGDLTPDDFRTKCKGINAEDVLAMYRIAFPVTWETTIDDFYGLEKGVQPFLDICHAQGYHTLQDLLSLDFKTVRIPSLRSKTIRYYEQSFLSLPLPHKESEILPIDEAYRNMDATALRICGLQTIPEGIETIGDLASCKLSRETVFAINKALLFLHQGPLALFLKAYASMKDDYQVVLDERAKGSTLDEIGLKQQLTRTRIAQIETSALRCLADPAELLCASLETDYAVASGQFLAIMDEQRARTLAYTLYKSSKLFSYLDYCGKFVNTHRCKLDIESLLSSRLQEISTAESIDESTLDRLLEHIHDDGLTFLNTDDIKGYLAKQGYRFYGDFIAKASTNAPVVYLDAITKYFDFGIKLDCFGNSDDLIRLRTILKQHYPGLRVPVDNRALKCSALRCKELILCDRGTYVPFSKVTLVASVLETIKQHILDASQNSFTYKELFTLYQEPLKESTSIDNLDFLHGVLMYLYPDTFDYRHHYLTKKDMPQDNTDSRIERFIKEQGRAVSFDELKAVIPGLNTWEIMFASTRRKTFFLWDERCWQHIDNIQQTEAEKAMLHEMIKQQTEQNNGYTSSFLCYQEATLQLPELLQRNAIDKPGKLFSLVNYDFHDDYLCTNPHILARSEAATHERLTYSTIVKRLLGDQETVTEGELKRIGERFAWPSQFLPAVLLDIEARYIRVSAESYLRRDLFHVTAEMLHTIEETIDQAIESQGYLVVDTMECTGDLNQFLLLSVVKTSLPQWKLVPFEGKDKRFPRAVIMSVASPINDYGSLVKEVLRENHITTIDETSLYGFLRDHKLYGGPKLPWECFSIEGLSFKDGVFTLL